MICRPDLATNPNSIQEGGWGIGHKKTSIVSELLVNRLLTSRRALVLQKQVALVFPSVSLVFLFFFPSLSSSLSLSLSLSTSISFVESRCELSHQQRHCLVDFDTADDSDLRAKADYHNTSLFRLPHVKVREGVI